MNTPFCRYGCARHDIEKSKHSPWHLKQEMQAQAWARRYRNDWRLKLISCYTHIYKIIANHPTYILWNAGSWTRLGIRSKSGCFGEFTQDQEATLPSWTILEDVQYPLQIRFGFTSGGTSGKEPSCQCRRLKRHGFNLWVSKIPWSRKWEPTPVFHGQRSLTSYNPWGCKQLDTTSPLSAHTPLPWEFFAPARLMLHYSPCPALDTW